jgi:hypothetical protein
VNIHVLPPEEIGERHEMRAECPCEPEFHGNRYIHQKLPEPLTQAIIDLREAHSVYHWCLTQTPWGYEPRYWLWRHPIHMTRRSTQTSLWMRVRTSAYPEVTTCHVETPMNLGVLRVYGSPYGYLVFWLDDLHLGSVRAEVGQQYYIHVWMDLASREVEFKATAYDPSLVVETGSVTQ